MTDDAVEAAREYLTRSLQDGNATYFARALLSVVEGMDAVETARRIVHAEDNRDSFPDGRPQWSKDLEAISRALLAAIEREKALLAACQLLEAAGRFDDSAR